jgi:ferredoxin
MKVRVLQDVCTGHAVCYEQGPDVFVLDDTGYNVTPDTVVAEELYEQARRGAAACPERAILLDDDLEA